MTRFVISDTHFGHKNILKFVDDVGNKIRPFSSLEVMHDVMLDNWNSVVKESDVVYHLGDVGFNKIDIEWFMSRCNGKCHLILGNHDNYKMSFYEGFFDSIQTVKKITNDRGVKLLLSHYPVHPFSLEGCINLHGHTHQRCLLSTDHLNMSVENINYTPYNLEKIDDLRQKDRQMDAGSGNSSCF